jgi:acyl transferase domain-containing protein
MNTNTACSSSLVAAHLANDALLAGEAAGGVCGGLNAMLLPSTSQLICALSALSLAARCKTFDASADGCASVRRL